MGFELNGKIYETDENGYLKNPKDWNEGVARYLGRMLGIELTTEHWVVIDIIRDYYQEYGYPPQMKVIVKEMEKRFGAKKGNRKYFYKLFPEGQYQQAYKIAGVSVSFPTCGCEAPLIRRYLWSETYGVEGAIVTELANT